MAIQAQCSVRLTRRYPDPPPEVWAALTEPQSLARWLRPGFEVPQTEGEHGLVQARAEGRERVYSLEPEPLEELDEWLSRYRSFWTNRLDALGVELRRRRKENR